MELEVLPRAVDGRDGKFWWENKDILKGVIECWYNKNGVARRFINLKIERAEEIFMTFRQYNSN